MHVKKFWSAPAQGIVLLMAALALLVLVAVLAATVPSTTARKDADKKAKGWLASITPPPTYALNPTAAQQQDAAQLKYIHGGYIASNQTWSPSQGVYIITSPIRISAGKTLTINAGTVIKIANHSTGIINEGGVLRVNGTATNPVVITSITDDAVGGDTNEDGPSFGSWNDYNNAIQSGADTQVKFAIIRNGSQSISAWCPSQAPLRITDNVLQGQLQVSSCGLGSTVVVRNQMGVPVMSAMSFHQTEMSGVALSGSDSNTFLLPDAGKAVELDYVYVAAGQNWRVGAGPVLVPQYLQVHGTLTLQLGAVVKTRPTQTAIRVELSGFLNAAGTTGSYVTFTSLRDDTIAGDTGNDGESYGSSSDYSAAVQSSGLVKLVRTAMSYASYGVSAVCIPGGGQSLVANFNAFNSALALSSCDVGALAIDRNTFNVPDRHAMDIYSSDVTNVLLSGVNRNYFNGADRSKVIYLTNSRVPAGSLWSFGAGQVVVMNQFRVEGALALEAGAVVKTAPGVTGIMMEPNASLQATGTSAARVTLTSLQDDSVGGDSEGNGAVGVGPNDYSAAINGKGIINLQFANIRNGSNSVTGACSNSLSSLVARDTIFKGHVYFYGCDTGAVVLERNTFAVDGGPAIAATYSELSGVALSGANRNTFSGTARGRAIDMYQSRIAAGNTWEISGAGGARPIVSQLQVDGTLHIASKTTVKVATGAPGVLVGTEGKLRVQGTASERVTFTSLKDDSLDGDTGGDGPTSGMPNDTPYAIRVGDDTDIEFATFKNFTTSIDGSCTYNGFMTERFEVSDSIFNSPVSVSNCDSGVADFKRNQFNVAGNVPAMSVSGADMSAVAMTGPDMNTFTGTGMRRSINLYYGVVSAGRTWDVSSAPGAVLVGYQVYLAGTLNLGPGVVVKSYANGASITVQPEGTLNSIGTAVSPVVFTSLKDDSVGGDTGGDGATTGSPRDGIGIRSYGTVTVRHTTMRNLYPAVDVSCNGSTGTSLTMTDNAMRGNVMASGCGSENISLARNQFNVAVGPAITVHNVEVSGIAMTGADKNTFTGGGQKSSVYLNGGYVGSGKSWNVDNSSGAVLASRGLYVDGSLTFGPGLVVKADRDQHPVVVGQYGVFNANGAAGNPVIFTSLKDDSVAGDTGGDGPTTGALRDARGIRVGGSTSIKQATIRNNFPAVDAYCNGGSAISSLEIKDSQINGMANIYSCPVAGSLDIRRNQFASPFGMAMSIQNSELSGIVLSGTDKNTFTGTDARRVVQVINGTLEQGRSWNLDANTGAVYMLGDVYVAGTLNVGSGVIIKVPFGRGVFTLAESAQFAVNGTAGSPVTITSAFDDSIGGDSLGDKATTSPAKNDYYNAIWASGDINSQLDFNVEHAVIKYPTTALQISRAKQASFTNVDIRETQLGLQIQEGRALLRAKLTNADMGVRSCNWGLTAIVCSVDAAYTDWGNASGPESCGAVATSPWFYNGTQHSITLFGSPNCDGSTLPTVQYTEAQAAFQQRLNPYQIDCSNGFEDACELIQTTMQCLAAAQQLAVNNSTFPLTPEDLAPDTVGMAADLYVESIAEQNPSFANRYNVATGILSVVGVYFDLASAYNQCSP